MLLFTTCIEKWTLIQEDKTWCIFFQRNSNYVSTLILRRRSNSDQELFHAINTPSCATFKVNPSHSTFVSKIVQASKRERCSAPSSLQVLKVPRVFSIKSTHLLVFYSHFISNLLENHSYGSTKQSFLLCFKCCE